MPGLDGTGPLGLGPGTGWGRGRCGVAGRRFFGRGRWFCGWGPAAGWWPRWRFWSGPAGGPFPGEKEILEQEKARLEQELEAINQRLANLTSSSS